jgi:hypothetical protein
MSKAIETLNDLHNRLVYLTEGLQAVGVMLTSNEQVPGTGSAIYSTALALSDITARLEQATIELSEGEE